VSAALDAVVDNAWSGWGSAAHVFNETARKHYVEALRDPARVHAICEEYRAAASLDHEHDRQDREAGRRTARPVLVLWSSRGALAVWRVSADDVRGRPLEGGHFFPEELPGETAAELSAFFAEA
jgi:haloacetate dehalogenase